MARVEYHYSHMSISQLMRNQRGIALLYLVIIFTLVGVLVSAGSRMLGSIVTQKKITDSKAELDRDVRMIIAWGVRNKRLPVAGEYVGVFGSAPQDAWGKTIGYAYDSNLAALGSGGLCGRTGTTGQEAVFLLISGGDDMSITSAPSIASGVLTGLQQDVDLYRIVTLNELQAEAGCFGSTQGSIRILNNELPKACKGISYSATLFAEGGVPPVTFSFTGLPTGITNIGAVLSGTTSVASGAYQVVVTANDNQAPTANTQIRKFFMNVTTCN